MKRILIITTLCFALLSYGLTPSSESESESEPQKQEMTLPDFISQIAEKDDITAADYAMMADGTMQVAMQLMQQGEKMPEAPIKDALDAVAAGRAMNPEETDWDKIEQRLLDLLNPPHQDQQQQQQQQQDSKDQEQQQDGEQKEQDGSSGSSEESGKDSKQSEDGSQGENSQEQQEGEKGDQGEPQEGQEGEQQSQDGQDQQSGGQEDENGESTQMPNTQDGAQMGELDQNQEEHQVELDGNEQQPQPAPQEQMQTLGGQQTTGEPVDAETAALRQLLEQLKQQDQPGKLYQILQEAQSGGKKKQQPNTKDW